MVPEAWCRPTSWRRRPTSTGTNSQEEASLRGAERRQASRASAAAEESVPGLGVLRPLHGSTTSLLVPGTKVNHLGTRMEGMRILLVKIVIINSPFYPPHHHSLSIQFILIAFNYLTCFLLGHYTFILKNFWFATLIKYNSLNWVKYILQGKLPHVSICHTRSFALIFENILSPTQILTIYIKTFLIICLKFVFSLASDYTSVVFAFQLT